MIADRKSTIEEIADIIGLLNFEVSNELLEDYDRKMQTAETKKDKSAGSLPNEQKQAYKARVSKLIVADPYFSRCSDLFNSLESDDIDAG